LLLTAVLLLTTCACAAPAAPQRPPLKVAYVLWPGYYPLLIAQEKGFFAEEGVEVEVILATASAQARADMCAGVLDGLTYTLAGIVGAAGECDARVIFATDESSGADAVVASAAIQSVQDLRRQRVGVGFGGYGEIILNAMLESAGMTSDDVVVVDVTGEAVPQAIQDGTIAAGVTWEPYVSQTVNAGGNIIFSTEQTPGLIPDVMAFHASTLRDRPDDVRAFVRAWFRAVDYWLANREEGYALLTEILQTSPEAVSLEGMRLLSLEDNRRMYTVGTTSESLYYTTQLYVDFYTASGAIGTSVDIDALLEPSFLE